MYSTIYIQYVVLYIYPHEVTDNWHWTSRPQQLYARRLWTPTNQLSRWPWGTPAGWLALGRPCSLSCTCLIIYLGHAPATRSQFLFILRRTGGGGRGWFSDPSVNQSINLTTNQSINQPDPPVVQQDILTYSSIKINLSHINIGFLISNHVRWASTINRTHIYSDYNRDF
jgi:hypothetical protein